MEKESEADNSVRHPAKFFNIPVFRQIKKSL